jgi:N-succinyldiaminopimelate aminotransferase
VSEPLVERMQGFGTTIFAEMTALAVRTGAINLGQGFPDTDGPPAMLEAAVEAIRAGANQYPPGPGLPELREAVAAQRLERYGLSYDPATEVLVTVGATEGIAASLLALAGAVRRTVTLRPEGGRFTFDPDELRAAIGPRTRLILVNSPHNPTGTVFVQEELEAIAAVCQEHDLTAITDEVYEYLTFDGTGHVPLATLPGMRERTVTLCSAGKSFSATGWKTGWVTAPAPYVRAVQTVKQFLTYTANGPFQRAAAYALRHELPWVEDLRKSLETKRDRLITGLEAAGFETYRPQGTYFVQADIRPLGFTDGYELARVLPERAGVVAIPSQVFYDHAEAGRHFVRFAFCKRDEVIDAAAERLRGLG